MGVIKFRSESEMYGCGWMLMTGFFIIGLLIGKFDTLFFISGIISLLGGILIYKDFKEKRGQKKKDS